MDNDTVLLVNGDHGMTLEGNHGGDSPKEIRTIFFAYTKSGFPMLKSPNKLSTLNKLKNSLSTLKLQDVAAIAASILQIPFPFSNIGIMHPLIYLQDDFYPKML